MLIFEATAIIFRRYREFGLSRNIRTNKSINALYLPYVGKFTVLPNQYANYYVTSRIGKSYNGRGKTKPIANQEIENNR